MEQIAEHNKPDDLWIVIDGKVFDVSKWAIYHPGGHLCLENVAGADATDAFENYHPACVRARLWVVLCCACGGWWRWRG